MIAYPMAVTPERAQRVAFSLPIETGVKQILVTGKNFGPVASLQDLSGKKVYVNPITTYYENLQKINDSLQAGQAAHPDREAPTRTCWTKT